MALSWVLCVLVAMGPHSVLLDSPQEPTDCWGRFDTFQFQILPTDFPQTQPWEHCVFEVYAASALVCGLYIDIGSLTLPACPSEWLMVDGKSFCGSNKRVIQFPFIQSPINITVKKSSKEDNVFNITVQQVECSRKDYNKECGGQVSEDIAVILSPGYPSGYTENLYCPYTIIPTDPSVCSVEVAFNDSAIESSLNCYKDSLTLGMHRMCGLMEGTVVLGMRGILDILFTTDNDTNSKGFNMTVIQKRCQNLISKSEPPRQNEKYRLDDVRLHSQVGNSDLILDGGYPQVEKLLSSFPLPTRWIEQLATEAYLPLYQSYGHNIPLEEEHPIQPPYRQFLPTLLHDCLIQSTEENNPNEKPPSVGYFPPEDYEEQISNIEHIEPQFTGTFNPTFIGSEPIHNFPLRNVPLQNKRPLNTQQTQFSQSLSGGFPFSPFNMFSATPSLRQCWGHIYSGSHFLIVSPNFPKFQSSHCIYTLSRFSPTTSQVRLLFRYFSVGEDSSEDCSGGFLEIDGTRICGCKTGLLFTSNFFDSEPAKILNFKSDISSNKLMNGFIIEVFQDDLYLQRFKRHSSSLEKEKSLINVHQSVETIIERNPVFPKDNNYPFHSFPVWKPSSQSLRLQSDSACLEWSMQNWLELLKTILLTIYQCPDNNDIVLSTACRSCQYFYRQNS